MNVNIPTPPTQWRNVRCACEASYTVTWTLTSTPPQPSDVTSDVHVTQVNMNVNIHTPQPSDVTSGVHVTQVNMNVTSPPTQWRNVICACDAS